MNIRSAESKWLPLREGILRLGVAPGWMERVSQRITARHYPVTLTYAASTQSFGISIVRTSPDGSSGYEVGGGIFRVGEDFRGELSEISDEEEGKMREALQSLGWIFQKRLQLGTGVDFDTYARRESPLAEQFSCIPSDAVRHLRIIDWGGGVADTVTG